MIVLGIFLAWQAIEDVKSKSIRIDAVVFFGIFGIVLRLLESGFQVNTVKELLVVCIPGGVFIIISYLFSGMIGEGDGMIFLISGIYMGMMKNVLLIYFSFLLVSIGGLGVVLFYRKRNRGKSYPFVPFIFAAFLVLELWGMRR